MFKLKQVFVPTLNLVRPLPNPPPPCPHRTCPYPLTQARPTASMHSSQPGATKINKQDRELATLQPFRVLHTTGMVSVQVITEKMWANRSERFPEETPSTHEYYLLRSIFEEHFPSKSALDTVPKVSVITVTTV